MGLVITTLTVAIALAREGIIRRIRRAFPYLNRAAGALLVVAGPYVAYYGYWELRILAGHDVPEGPVAWVSDGSARATQRVDDLGVLIFAAALAGLIGVGQLRRRRNVRVHLDGHVRDRGTDLDPLNEFLSTPQGQAGVTVHESLLGVWCDLWKSHTFDQVLTSPVDPRQQRPWSLHLTQASPAQALEAVDQVGGASEAERSKRGRGETRAVPLVAHDDDPPVVSRLGDSARHLGVEPPLQDVAVDHQGA